MIITNEYKVASKDYLMIVFYSLLQKYWSWILLIFTALITLSVLDVRWLIVLLNVIFIIIPFIMAYLYIWHGMKPEVRYSTVEKHVTLSEKGLLVEYNDSKNTLIKWDEISEARNNDKFIIFTFKKSKYLYFIIPHTAFRNENDIKEVKEYIMKLMPSNDGLM